MAEEGNAGDTSVTSATQGLFGLGGADKFGTSIGGMSTGSVLGAAGDLFSDVGGAVGGYFAYQGAKKQAELYGEAATIAGENATEEQGLTQLKEVQQRRQLSMVLGTQQADIGANNFASSGTARDRMKSSQQQGALAVGMTQQQGAINVNAFRQQQIADQAQQQQAKSAEGGGIASMVGGIVKAVGTLAMLA